jgi:phospholipase/carboxylesterase
MIQDFYILSSVRKAPKYLIIVLHGYGANGKNLLSMTQYWKNILKDTLFVVPNAPIPLPHSPNGYQWFDIGDLSVPYLRKGSHEAAPILRDFIINIQTSYKIPGEKTTLTGFSQGGMLALATGLLYENLCKGILSYSGGLFLPPEQLSLISPKIDICLVHGTADTVVPCSASKETETYLTKRNNKVIFHPIPNLAHQINETGLLQGAHFIKSLAS